MTLIPLLNPTSDTLITVSTCSFIILKGTAGQLLTLYAKTRKQCFLSALFTSTMSFNGLEEDLILKAANTQLDQTEPYGVALFGKVAELNLLNKKKSRYLSKINDSCDY